MDSASKTHRSTEEAKETSVNADAGEGSSRTTRRNNTPGATTPAITRSKSGSGDKDSPHPMMASLGSEEIGAHLAPLMHSDASGKLVVDAIHVAEEEASSSNKKSSSGSGASSTKTDTIGITSYATAVTLGGQPVPPVSTKEAAVDSKVQGKTNKTTTGAVSSSVLKEGAAETKVGDPTADVDHDENIFIKAEHIVEKAVENVVGGASKLINSLSHSLSGNKAEEDTSVDPKAVDTDNPHVIPKGSNVTAAAAAAATVESTKDTKESPERSPGEKKSHHSWQEGLKSTASDLVDKFTHKKKDDVHPSKKTKVVEGGKTGITGE